MAKRVETVEVGIFRRVSWRTGEASPWLWIHYPGPGGRTVREPAKTKSIQRARRLRARRMEQRNRGEVGRAAERVLVRDLLAALEVDYRANQRASLAVLGSYLKALEPLAGLRAIDLTTSVVQEQQARWTAAGKSNATINRWSAILRRAFVLGVRAQVIQHAPYIPALTEHSPRGRYLSPAELERVQAALPEHLRPFVAVAYAIGTRRGQLARTLRAYYDAERGVIAWPAAETKSGEAHTVPLDAATRATVERLMETSRWCRFLFHGRHCAPGRAPSKRLGCLGNITKSWRTALKAAGLPAGRKAGGHVFHDTRRSAATNLRAAGLDEGDAMRVTGHRTRAVFARYDLGSVEALRARLERAAEYRGTLVARPIVIRLPDAGGGAHREAACTTAAPRGA